MFESPFIFQAVGKLNAIVGEDRVHMIRHRSNQTKEELAGSVTSLVRMQFGIGELGRAVDSDKEIEPPFFCRDFSNVHMKVTDWVMRELLLRGLVTNLRQATNAVTLQTAMETGASQVRNACLESIETIIIVVRAYVDGKLQSLLLAQS